LIRAKALDETIQPVITKIEEMATSVALDPLITSTDIYVTSICLVGAKSLSHVLSCIERCKERLLAIGPQSEAARRQIITSVMSYWEFNPGTGVNIIDKLLNYTILTPMSVIEWALVTNSNQGRALAKSYIYEMISSTIYKVTNRVRQISRARLAPGLNEEQRAVIEETARSERANEVELFRVAEDALTGWASGTKDQGMENANVENGGEPLVEEHAAMVREWGQRWLRVFRRKFAVEEAFLLDIEKAPVPATIETVVAIEHNGTENGDVAATGDAMEDVEV